MKGLSERYTLKCHMPSTSAKPSKSVMPQFLSDLLSDRPPYAITSAQVCNLLPGWRHRHISRTFERSRERLG